MIVDGTNVDGKLSNTELATFSNELVGKF